MNIWDSWWVLQFMQMLGLLRFWISFAKFRTLFSRAFGFGHNIIKVNCNAWISISFNGLVTSGSLISLLLVLSWAYSYAFPSSHSVIQSYEIPNSSHTLVQSNEILKPNVSMGTCNVFEGSWIRDDSYPLYDASHCPFAERGFNCLANGRKDRGYSKWRWKPKNCDIPRFDAIRILEQLRGKRVVFVGDSLSRTQWESLICLLMTGVEDKKSVYEIKGNKITKQIRFLGVRFSSFDVRIDFYRSLFLVKPGSVPRHAPPRVKTTLRLDKMDDISHEWIDSDVLIFNSGHWWTRTKLFDIMHALLAVYKSEIFISDKNYKKIDVSLYWVFKGSSTSTSFSSNGNLINMIILGTIGQTEETSLGSWSYRTIEERILNVGSSLKLGMPINSAFNTALHTWASWVENTINTNRTRIFFRTFESSHWSEKSRNACKVTRRPWKRTNGKDRSPISDMIKRVVKKMSAPVTVLHVTPMGAYRSDGHVGTWSDNPSVPDCSHWCLPGVPDMWNEILFSYLLPKDGIN